jgi:hypothetical protein
MPPSQCRHFSLGCAILHLLIHAAHRSIAQEPLRHDLTEKDASFPLYSPARPPSIPLAVRSPYTSVWSSTSNRGTLNGGPVHFWTGDPIGWEGIVLVDGVAYEYMGVGSRSLPKLPASFQVQSAVPQAVKYDSQYSNFTFLAGNVSVVASFFSPVTPRDVCRSSIPLSYLVTSIQAMDNATHDIRLYSHINAA